jgi:hypothetical protein
MRRFDKATNMLLKAQQIRSKVYGLPREKDRKQLEYEIMLYPDYQMAKETELLDAIQLYVRLCKTHYDGIKFKEDSFAKYLDLFRVAPEALCQPQYQFDKFHKYYEIVEYFQGLRESLDTQTEALETKLGDPRANQSKIWVTVTTLLFSMQGMSPE